MSNLVITSIGELVTNDPAREGLSGVLHGAAVVIQDGVISWVGQKDDLPTEYSSLPVMDAAGASVVPGFVDAHTHVVFAGDRSHEHAMRLAGASYAEIQSIGGGIYSTVRATREATLVELVVQSLARVQRMLAAGTTTIEIKTGYGLNIETEVAMLDAIEAIDSSLPLDVIKTFIGAHVVAPEFTDDRQGYVDLVSGDMFDAVDGRVDFVDVFCDEIAFSVAEAEQIVEAAAGHGIPVRLHVEQLSHSGGAALAARVGAVAADHLDHASDEDLAALASAGTVAVLLPGVSFTMQEPPPDGRRFWDAGVTVAIATDCNPGTSYIETMPFIIALAATTSGLTPDEALWAATAGGALALGMHDRGIVAEGYVGDLVVLSAPSYEHLVYRPDGDLVRRVVKAGVPL